MQLQQTLVSGLRLFLIRFHFARNSPPSRLTGNRCGELPNSNTTKAVMQKFSDWFVNQPYLMLTLTPMIWGGNAIAGKMAVGHISPALLVCLRWFFALLIILPFALPHLKRELPHLRPHLPYLFALGAIGFAFFNNIMYLALNYTSAINVGIEQAAMPLVVFLLNFALFRIRSTWLQIAGFVLTLLGVATTITNGNPFDIFNQTMNYGDLIMLVAVFAYGGYSVALKNKPEIHWMNFIAILGFSAFITSIFFALYEWNSGNIVLPDWQAMGIVAYIALFPSIIAQLLWMRGLELIGSNRGGVFINLVPIFGALFAILLLGEKFQLFHAVSMVLVIGGVALAQYTRNGELAP